ncbi:30S ribosomal protein S4, partial [Escherichia coli]|nr:30S ribosomal protein S4 [Escherichia coli]
DVVEVREKAKKQMRINASLDLAQQRPASAWLEVDAKGMKGTFKTYPDMLDLPSEFKVNLIVELYSK